MTGTENKIDKIARLLEAALPYIEWTHNYSVAQVRLLKLSQLETKHIVEFYYQGTVPVRFYVPKGDIDHIQSHYLMSETFWDQDTLEALGPLLQKRHVLDIGANVGNHSVFWGALSGAASIQAFEPIPETFNILKRNIELNKLSKIVKIHRCALGATNGTGDPASRGDNRMQATVSARTDASGAIPLRTLDSFNFRNVDFAKIDVEGHTSAMLKGAEATLRRHSPTLYIELFPFERQICKDYLDDLGYQVLGSIEDGNFLFVHGSKSEEAQHFRSVIKGAWMS